MVRRYNRGNKTNKQKPQPSLGCLIYSLSYFVGKGRYLWVFGHVGGCTLYFLGAAAQLWVFWGPLAIFNLGSPFLAPCQSLTPTTVYLESMSQLRISMCCHLSEINSTVCFHHKVDIVLKCLIWPLQNKVFWIYLIIYLHKSCILNLLFYMNTYSCKTWSLLNTQY